MPQAAQQVIDANGGVIPQNGIAVSNGGYISQNGVLEYVPPCANCGTSMIEGTTMQLNRFLIQADVPEGIPGWVTTPSRYTIQIPINALEGH